MIDQPFIISYMLLFIGVQNKNQTLRQSASTVVGTHLEP